MEAILKVCTQLKLSDGAHAKAFFNHMAAEHAHDEREEDEGAPGVAVGAEPDPGDPGFDEAPDAAPSAPVSSTLHFASVPGVLRGGRNGS